LNHDYTEEDEKDEFKGRFRDVYDFMLLFISIINFFPIKA
jgi:hypothetical protein